MAVKDVQAYFYTMLSQYLEEKEDLKDFEEALEAGLITEEQMQEVQDTVSALETNYHRLVYIMYLLNIPNRKEKKANYAKQHENILKALKELGADADSVKAENTDALIHFRAKLKKLKEQSKTS